MIKVKEVDINSFSGQSTKRKYPYIELLQFNNTLPLVVGLLDSGEMQVQATHKGVTKVICNVSSSAYNIDKLLRTGQQVRFWLSEDQFKDIESIEDYLEVI